MADFPKPGPGPVRVTPTETVPPVTPPATPPTEKTDGGLKIERSRRETPTLDTTREALPWERDDAPAGSTEASVLVEEDGKAPRVSGPTHYAHLANGQIVGSFGVGTHVDNGDGPIPVVAHYQG